MMPFLGIAAFALAISGCANTAQTRTYPDDAVLTFEHQRNGVTIELLRVDAQRRLVRGARPKVKLSPGGHYLRFRIKADARVLGYRSAAYAAFPLRTYPNRTYLMEVTPVEDRFELTVFDTTDNPEDPPIVFDFSVPAAHAHRKDVQL